MTTDPFPVLAVEPIEPWSELVREWVAARLPGHDAPGGIQRLPNRVEMWQTRLRDPAWRSNWRAAIRRAALSKACRGEDPNFLARGLRIDWFLKNTNWVGEILAGNYDDPRSATAPADRRQAEIDAVFAEAAAKRKAG